MAASSTVGDQTPGQTPRAAPCNIGCFPDENGRQREEQPFHIVARRQKLMHDQSGKGG